MLLSLEETVTWLGMTVFEIWLHLLSLLAFTILLVLRLDKPSTGESVEPPVTWLNVFTPLFVADGLAAYFCIIVFVRMFRSGSRRWAGMRAIASLMTLTCLFVFELLLCQKLSREHDLTYSEVFASLFILQQVLMVRVCLGR